MCRPSKIDGRCEIRLLYLLKTLILYISCMRITPRVCTSLYAVSVWARVSCIKSHLVKPYIIASITLKTVTTSVGLQGMNNYT